MRWACEFDARASSPDDEIAACYLNPAPDSDWIVEPGDEYRWTWRFYVEAGSLIEATQAAWTRFAAERLPDWAPPLTHCKLRIDLDHDPERPDARWASPP